jgi:DNA polymerase-3 subunit alpha
LTTVLWSEFLRKELEDSLKDKPIVDTMEFGTNVCQLPEVEVEGSNRLN